MPTWNHTHLAVNAPELETRAIRGVENARPGFLTSSEHPGYAREVTGAECVMSDVVRALL